MNIVNLFYKGFIQNEENYVVIKHELVYFESDDINMFYELKANEVGKSFSETQPKNTWRTR